MTIARMRRIPLLCKEILAVHRVLLKTARARKRPRGFESHALRSTAGKMPAEPGNQAVLRVAGGLLAETL
jgi:hypothetical protein